MIKVLVSVIAGSGWVHKFCARALRALEHESRADVTIIDPTGKPYVSVLNKCVRQVIRDNYDYWITFDDDNPPMNNPVDLCFLDKDVIGCPTPVWHSNDEATWPWYWNAMDEKEDGWLPHAPMEGLQKVDAVGSGCMVIARRVLDVVHPAFARVWNADGVAERGHDYEFGMKCKAAGFQTWAHFDYPCHHFCELDITEIIRAISAVKGVKNG